MPALNFQARFAPLVESGKKCQTIRKHRNDGRDPKPGDVLYLYTGMRTKKCRKLAEVRCTSVTEIRMGYLFSISIDRGLGFHPLNKRQRRELAKRDGFHDAGLMLTWFDKTYSLPFEGLLIRWR